MNPSQSFRFINACVAGSVLLISGCATTSVLPGTSAPVAERSAEQPAAAAEAAEQAPPTVGTTSSPAVVALLQDADRQSQAGSLTNAAAILERALRIEPRNAELWHNLANVRLQQGQLELAESLALKSNVLAGQNVALQARNWRLIAEARRTLGDMSGARVAEKKAAALASGPR